MTYTHVSISLHWKYWHGMCMGWYLFGISQNLIPKLTLLQIQNFFQFFLLIELWFFQQKMQNGLCCWPSRAKMGNHNKKYYPYPESSWYALFKTAKKNPNFLHLSFWTYWTQISNSNHSALGLSQNFMKNHWLKWK